MFRMVVQRRQKPRDAACLFDEDLVFSFSLVLDRGTLSKPIVSLRSLQQACLCVGWGGGGEREGLGACTPQHVALYFGREKERERTRFIEERTRAPTTLDE